jgi:ankyrin repeat protein
VRGKITRHGYQTTFERFQSGPSFLDSALPSHIRISTPPPTSASGPDVSMSVVRSSNYRLTSFEPSEVREMIFQWSEMTPWHNFLLFIERHKESSILSLPLPWSDANTEHLIQGCRLGKNDQSHEIVGNTCIPQYEASQAQDWLLDLLKVKITIAGVDFISLDPQCIDPRLYLPIKRDGGQDIDMNAVTDLSHPKNQLEFLKLAVKLLADNAEVPGLALAIVQLAEDSCIRSALQHLLGQGLLSIEAFAEKLLIPAIRAGSEAVVEMLVNAGVHTNGGASLALEYAIVCGHKKIVDFLLRHGSSARTKYSSTARYIVRRNMQNLYTTGTISEKPDTLFDLAVVCGNVNVVETIMSFKFTGRVPPTSINTVWHAARLHDPELLIKLCSSDPIALSLVKANASAMMRCAAYGGSIQMVEYLLSHGLDVNATKPIARTTDLGEETALATASSEGHLELVTYLISKGADIDGQVQGLNTVPPLWEALRCYYNKGYRDATCIIRLLLGQKADPNICWSGLSALQIATVGWEHGRPPSKLVVGMLLDAGADPDACIAVQKPRLRWGNLIMILNKPSIKIALLQGNAEIFYRLLDAGAKLGGPWDALLSAFIGGDRKLVEVVLKKIPNNLGSPECLEACITAFGCGFARELLARGVFNAATALRWPGVICAAVYEDDMEFVRMCCDLHGLSTDYWASALAMAAQQHNIGMVQLILKTGCKPYTGLTTDLKRTEIRRETGIYGELRKHKPRYELYTGTNAMYAVCQLWANRQHANTDQAIRTARLLIDSCKREVKHSDEEKARKDSWRTLFEQAVAYAPLSFVRSLVHMGFSVDETDVQSRSLLQITLETLRGARGHDETTRSLTVAEYLIKQGAEPNCPAIVVFKSPLNTALQYTAQYNSISLTRALLDRKADVNAAPAQIQGATALQFAAMNGNFEMAFMLLEAGANINAPPALFDGRTTLEGAAEHGRLHMVRFLLAAGADVGGKNNKNYVRAVYRAWANNHRTIVKMIQEFKRERYGLDDVEDVEVIVRSMTQDELDFWDLEEEAAWPTVFAIGRDPHRYPLSARVVPWTY